VSTAGEIGDGIEAMSSPLALHLLGILCAYEGRYEEAEEAFLRAVEADPEMAGSYVELGLVFACRGEYTKMVEALKHAVAVGPGGVRAYLGERPFGDLTAAAGAPDASRQAAPDAEGEGVALLLTSATSYLARGRDDEAVVMLGQVLDGKSENPPALVWLLALAYLLRGEGVEADETGVRRAAAAVAGRRARQC
jgi:tetratricopeptide (TPR) repeat protein